MRATQRVWPLRSLSAAISPAPRAVVLEPPFDFELVDDPNESSSMLRHKEPSQ